VKQQKQTKKLILARETVRQLRPVELAKVGGAGAAAALDSEAATCPWTHATAVNLSGG